MRLIPLSRAVFGCSRSRRGMALVMILAIVVLATAAVLAFYAHATVNRKIEASRANRTEADILALSGGDYVINQFLREIADSPASLVSTVGDVSIYQPGAASNGIPRRVLGGAVAENNADFFALIRQSTSDPNASADSSATPSRNGRMLSSGRWNAPALLGGAGFADPAQLPLWIYVHRSSGMTNAASAGVIGRIAYNVYDVGGMLDVNVAGFPAAAAGGVAGLKGTQAGADLTQLGLPQAAIDQLVQFRNAASAGASAGFSDWAAASARSGFLSNVVSNVSGGVTNVFTNSAFLSRQDLLHYVRTQNSALAAGLPFFTHYSRSVNAATWAPLSDAGTGFAYKSDGNLVTSTNRFLANVRFPAAGEVTRHRDDGSAETYKVAAGDPLLQRRFPLSKLNWLTRDGPLAGISEAAIKSSFGLRWDNTAKHWEYVGDGNALQSHIKTLNEVAAAGREPNFFELLKAGVLSGSLGKCGYAMGSSRHGYSNGGIEGYERSALYQLVRIAANIIDQWDANSFPTAITIGDGAGLPLRLCGIEDLPYFNKVIPVFHWPGAPNGGEVGNPGVPPVNNYLVYELWNPHQPAMSSEGPAQFRARIIPGASYSVAYQRYDFAQGKNVPVWPLGGGPWDPNYRLPLDAALNATLVFTADSSSSDPQRSYREPRLIRTGVAPRTTAAFDASLDVLGLITVTSTNTMPGKLNASLGADLGSNAYFYPYNVVIALDYLDKDGSYRPYTAFLGHEEVPLSGWGGGTTMASAPAMGITTGTSGPVPGKNNSGVGWQGIGKVDPRSYRFDASFAMGGSMSARPNASAFENGWHHNYPEFFGSSYTWGFPAPISLLARNKPGSNPLYPESYADPDGVTRPADGYHGDRNPYQSNVQAARPRMLNRAFRSVAELGFAFRDQPFKTLDFFSSMSADAALLDMFSVAEEPEVVAGRVHLNTRLSAVRRSLLSGAEGITNASATADAFQNYAFSAASASPTTNLPTTVAGLSSFAFSFDPGGAASQLKSESEAAVRAMVGASQTRTWNLLIDVVAQVGKFPGSMSAGGFVVEAEKRYWVSVAIDRYTGKIVDQQWETVNE